jgi:hypothetical protein
MKRTRRLITGIFLVAFGALGMYCSFRALQIRRELNGRPDVDDSVRDWSTGATACFVVCGVIAVSSKKRVGSAVLCGPFGGQAESVRYYGGSA